MTVKDYSLLRPFDLEAAKRGEPICYGACGDYGKVKFLAEAGPDGDHAIRDSDGNNYAEPSYALCMAPLTWVEGKPVYIDDVMYANVENISPHPNGLRITGVYPNGNLVWESIGDTRTSIDGYSAHLLTWKKPKVKREGWINIYPTTIGYAVASTSVVHPSKRSADEMAETNRIDCIHIKWEEQ